MAKITNTTHFVAKVIEELADAVVNLRIDEVAWMADIEFEVRVATILNKACENFATPILTAYNNAENGIGYEEATKDLFE